MRIARSIMMLGLLLSSATLTTPAVAAPWAMLGPYYPGMSKSAAKAAGIKDCKEEAGHVICSSTAVTRLGTLIATDVKIRFNSAGTAVDRMTARWPSKDVDPEMVTATTESAFGKGRAISDVDSNCSEDVEWVRSTDERVSLCIALSRTSYRNHYVTLELVSGLGKRAAAERQAVDAKQQRLDSFK